jgi:pimeloyl-ACP methyl ester carboxylesterase
VQSVEEGGYELAWDSAIARTLVVGDRRGIEFGSDFSYGVDLWPVWNAVRCPTLVLRGGKSAVLSATTARRMRRCKVLLQPTPDAIRAFNRSHAKKIGLFHVTC